MDKRLKNIFTAVHNCNVVAVDTNLKNLLEKIYQRKLTSAEYMKAYRNKSSKFDIVINDKNFTINVFENGKGG